MIITEKDQPKVLAALYNASAPIGIGFLQYDKNPMTEEQAQELLSQYTRYDYLFGRLMKVSFENEDVYLGLYNRDNGDSWAEMAIAAMLESGDANCAEIQSMHKIRMEGGKQYTRNLIANSKSETKMVDGVTVITMGMSAVADVLNQAVDSA